MLGIDESKILDHSLEQLFWLCGRVVLGRSRIMLQDQILHAF